MSLFRYNLNKISVLYISSRVDATFPESSISVCYPTLSFCKALKRKPLCLFAKVKSTLSTNLQQQLSQKINVKNKQKPV